jgi:hypothetical protein
LKPHGALFFFSVEKLKKLYYYIIVKPSAFFMKGDCYENQKTVSHSVSAPPCVQYDGRFKQQNASQGKRR